MVGWPGSRQNSLFTITADTHEVRHNPEYYVMRHFEFADPADASRGFKATLAPRSFNTFVIE